MVANTSPHVIKVPYISPGGRYRPYLEIIFGNARANSVSSKALALLDTGADHTVIPYSIGKQLQLTPPENDTEIQSVSGVSGSTTYLERDCEIYIIDLGNNSLYKFSEKVWWIHPSIDAQEALSKLAQRFTAMDELKRQSKKRTNLEKYFEEEKTRIGEEYRSLIGAYETDVLIGRPFLDNFDYVQFFHRDRTKESKCFFNYKLSTRKAHTIIPITNESK